MFHALSWFVVAALIALWSLVAWTLQAVALWTVSNAGALTGAASSAGAVALPGWLKPWVSPDIAQWVDQRLAGLGTFVDGLLQAAPAFAGGLTVAAWVVWGLGSLLLVLLGVGLHMLIALWRRRGGGSGSRTAGSAAAAG